MLKGIPASPGIIAGKAFLFDIRQLIVTEKDIKQDAVPSEITRFEEALIKTRSEILTIQKKISREMGAQHAEIFNAHLLVLEDRTLIEEIIEGLKKELKCVNIYFRKL